MQTPLLTSRSLYEDRLISLYEDRLIALSICHLQGSSHSCLLSAVSVGNKNFHAGTYYSPRACTTRSLGVSSCTTSQSGLGAAVVGPTKVTVHFDPSVCYCSQKEKSPPHFSLAVCSASQLDLGFMRYIIVPRFTGS